MGSTKLRCLCDHEQQVVFRTPKLFSGWRVVPMTCEACRTVWELKFRSVPHLKKGHYQIKARATSVSMKAVKAMKANQIRKGTTMGTNLAALEAAIKLIIDAGEDTIKAAQPGETALERLLAYANLGPDIVAFIPQIGEIPKEISALQPPDIETLVKAIVADLAISDSHAQLIIDAALKVLHDILVTLVPDVETLVAAIKASVPPVSAAPAAAVPTPAA